jgi:hypothetical protein
VLQNVATASFAMSILSFLAFLFFLFRSSGSAPPPAIGGAQAQGTIEDMSKLIEALAKLAETLSKSGPAIACLISAIFFMLLAAFCAGLANLSGAETNTALMLIPGAASA